MIATIVRRKRTERRKTIDEKRTEPYRRAVRFSYISLQHRINEEQDDIASARSNKFSIIINDVEKLHELVVKPREQVADAEVLLGLTNAVLNGAKSQGLGYISPSEFVTSLIRKFAVGGRGIQNTANTIHWKALGRAAPPSLKKPRGCLTMVGPMKTLVLKRRNRRGGRQTLKLIALPKQVTAVKEDHLSTEMNIAVMFEILKKHKSVKLEHLVLNRRSFAQTVENLFALSFLVKDGRVSVIVDDNGSHLVSPRNAPDRDLIVSQKVEHNHFVFRLDFPDWKLMMDYVPEGEELMSHRNFVDNSEASEEDCKPKKYALMLSNSTPPPMMIDSVVSLMKGLKSELKVYQRASKSNRTSARLDSRNRVEMHLQKVSVAEEILEALPLPLPLPTRCKRKLF